MLALEGMDLHRPIALYINSPGGSLTAMMAIIDTMRFVAPTVETTCVGQAASASAVLLAAGGRGRRAALANARVLLHQPRIDQPVRGMSSDVQIQAEEVLRLRAATETIVAEATGRTPQQVRADLDRDRWFTAEQARDYGLVDQILTHRRLP
jgi:ATP-dependent Clp protease, protease subunit